MCARTWSTEIQREAARALVEDLRGDDRGGEHGDRIDPRGVLSRTECWTTERPAGVATQARPPRGRAAFRADQEVGMAGKKPRRPGQGEEKAEGAMRKELSRCQVAEGGRRIGTPEPASLGRRGQRHGPPPAGATAKPRRPSSSRRSPRPPFPTCR
jgi:hypothetical protein